MEDLFDKPASSYQENFAMIIPHDVFKHPDGTASTSI